MRQKVSVEAIQYISYKTHKTTATNYQKQTLKEKHLQPHFHSWDAVYYVNNKSRKQWFTNLIIFYAPEISNKTHQTHKLRHFTH